MSKTNLGKRIKKFRSKLNISQDQLAKKQTPLSAP